MFETIKISLYAISRGVRFYKIYVKRFVTEIFFLFCNSLCLLSRLFNRKNNISSFKQNDLSQWRTTRAPPPERLRGGTHGGGSFNITSACISLPQARHIGVPRGGSSPLAPPLGVPKIKIKRKLRLESNT